MKRKLRKAITQIAFFIYNRIAYFVLPVKDDKVLFATEARKELEGNLKAIYDATPDNFEKVVHCSKDRRDKISVKETFALWNDLATAKYIFLDDFYGLISVMKVRSNQEIIQLWHGSGAYKKFGFSRMNTGDNITSVHKGYRKYTMATVTSESVRWCFAEAFDISFDKVEALGSPRTDMFFDDDLKNAAVERVYNAFPELKGKKIILIAPTYRGRKVEDADYAFDKLNLQSLVWDFENEYQIVVKWHPALYNNIEKGIRQVDLEGATDVSKYSDINDLLIASDILITDYSSVIFDWYLLNKPIIYFAYDLKEYENGRGLYFGFDEYVYGKVATNYKELYDAIKANDLQSKHRKAFGKNFMEACDGKSTVRVIDRVFGGRIKDDSDIR